MFPKSNDWCPYKKKGHIEIHRKERGHVKTPAEMERTQLQRKECQELPEPPKAGRSKEGFFPRTFREQSHQGNF